MFVTRRLLDRQLQDWLKVARRRRHRRRRPCNRKRRRNRWPPLLWVDDWNKGSLVYSLRLEAVVPPPSSAAGSPELFRPCVEPLIRWSEGEEKIEYNDLAAVSGGGTIVGVVAGSSRRTVVHDGATGAATPGPNLRRSKRRPIMLPIGDDDDTVLVMKTITHPRCHCIEALRRRRKLPGGGGGGWRADALPDPPLERGTHIMAYFAQGTRAWISLLHEGTFSLDVAAAGSAWRREGTWELPWIGRGILVQELGLVIGIAREGMAYTLDDPEHTRQYRHCHVCAVDVVEARPPAVRRVWEIPAERVDQVVPWEMVSLAHLGNGSFCMARSIEVDVDVPNELGHLYKGRGTSFTLADVRRLPGADDDLELVTHGKVQPHVWPWSHYGHASFLQPA
nr:unnamed protein product [Digitaria exilis]